jgi:F-type H+-transporting ATPase subunit epsilon
MTDKFTDKTFQFELVSPEKVLLSQQVSLAVIPGSEGVFGVLADHAPFLTSLRPGVVQVTLPDGAEQKIFVAGGFADVSGNVCAVLAEDAVNVDTLDKAVLEQQAKNLEDDLGFAKDDALKSAQIRKAMELTREKIRAVS